MDCDLDNKELFMKLLNQSLITTVFCLMLCLPFYVYSAITRTYHFPPNQAVTIHNPLYWELDTHCKISSADTADKLVGFMVHKNGKINGISIKQGQDLTVTVHPGEDFHLQADFQAVVKVTNYGQSMVSAKCRI